MRCFLVYIWNLAKHFDDQLLRTINQKKKKGEMEFTSGWLWCHDLGFLGDGDIGQNLQVTKRNTYFWTAK